ncbi:MAG: methyl-accepting chemotaxis protein, partial [Gallionella sp.]|nr:methyl-accepting chemotaxis protein [Gallionella sp.]
MFKNMKMAVRLALGFGAVIVMFVVTLLFVGVSLSQLTNGVRQINDETLPYVLVVDEMDVNRSEVQQFLSDIAATHDSAGYKDADEAAKRFLEGIGKYKQMFQRENDAGNLKKMEVIEADFNRFYADGKKMAELYVSKGREAGNVAMEGFDKNSKTLSEELAKFREQQVAEARQIAAGTLSTANSTMSVMIWGSLVAALLAAVLSVWIIRGLLRQLGSEPSYVVAVVSRVADGDLTVQVETRANDKTSMLFAIRGMVEKLSGIITEVRAAADNLSSASEEVSATAQSISQATSEQAASVEQTSASIEQMSASINQNTENAKVTDGMASKASRDATEGGTAVQQTVAAMQQIAKKIGIIDDIAYQTNLLALNAA